MPNDSDPRLDEWKECRSTIDHFDKIIVDVRKYGFSLITGILTASSIIFTKTHLPPSGQSIVSILAMALIYALFRIDRYHEVFLNAAVNKSIELEIRLGFGLSSRIDVASKKARADTSGRILYRMFIGASLLISIGAYFIMPIRSFGFLNETN